MKNWFPTLNDALEAESLVSHWPFGVNISYNETVSISSGGQWISVCRDERGFYERPIHYATKVKEGSIIRSMNALV